MPRLVVMSGSRILGGAELSLLALATRLPNHGWDVVLTCPPGKLADGAAARGVPVVTQEWTKVGNISSRVDGAKRYSAKAMAASTGATAANGVRLARLLRTSGATAVLSNSLPTHLSVGLAGRLARIPSMWYLREIVDPGVGRRLLEAAGKSAVALLSISNAVTAAMKHPTIFTIPEPIEPPDTPIPPKSKGGARRVIGYLGRLDPRKGVDDICRAAGLVDADVLIAGTPLVAPPSYVDELKALAEENAPGRVTFLGAVPSPWSFLSSVDVLVVPSRREPWGRVAAEALMARVPVIAADAGGLPEIVRDEVDGLLYPPGDVPALAGQLQRVLFDDELRDRLANAAGEVSHRFDPDAHTAHVAAAMNQVVGAGRSAP